MNTRGLRIVGDTLRDLKRRTPLPFRTSSVTLSRKQPKIGYGVSFGSIILQRSSVAHC